MGCIWATNPPNPPGWFCLMTIFWNLGSKTFWWTNNMNTMELLGSRLLISEACLGPILANIWFAQASRGQHPCGHQTSDLATESVEKRKVVQVVRWNKETIENFGLGPVGAVEMRSPLGNVQYGQGEGLSITWRSRAIIGILVQLIIARLLATRFIAFKASCRRFLIWSRGLQLHTALGTWVDYVWSWNSLRWVKLVFIGFNIFAIGIPRHHLCHKLLQGSGFDWTWQDLQISSILLFSRSLIIHVSWLDIWRIIPY